MICLRFLIKELAVARNAMERVVKMLKNVRHVKDKEELSKCSKWVPECISKSKKIVINVKVKDK